MIPVVRHPQDDIQSILDQHFLTSSSWRTKDDKLDDCFVFEFGARADTEAVMDLMTLAFRCSESTGAVLTVSSIGFPRFVRSEVDTLFTCSANTRYRLFVVESKAKAFAELLQDDMDDVDGELALIHESIRERLSAYARKWMWLFFGMTFAELAFAIVIGAMGLYFHSLEEGNVALWWSFPLCALMLFRTALGASKGWSYYKKLKS